MPEPGDVSLADPQRRWKKKRYWLPVTVIALLAGLLFARERALVWRCRPQRRPLPHTA
ncbi:hypothetical protein [Nocardia sp. NPDC047654]|uniref:hypothetical protein n=1 Tax=Nocardia sp. NPDC047654 TaxID=3364314 RepID=UPI003722BBB3